MKILVTFSLLALITLSTCERNQKLRRRGIITSYPHYGPQNGHQAIVYNNQYLPHGQIIVGQNKNHGSPLYLIGGQPMSLIHVNNHVFKPKKHPNRHAKPINNKIPQLHKTAASNIVQNSVGNDFKSTPIYHHTGQSTYGHNIVHLAPQNQNPSYTVGQSYKVANNPIVETYKPQEDFVPVMVPHYNHIPVPVPVHQAVPETNPAAIPVKQYVAPKPISIPVIQHQPVYQHVRMIPQHYPVTHNVPVQHMVVQNPGYIDSEDDEPVKPVQEEDQDDTSSGGHSYSYYTSVTSKIP